MDAETPAAYKDAPTTKPPPINSQAGPILSFTKPLKIIGMGPIRLHTANVMAKSTAVKSAPVSADNWTAFGPANTLQVNSDPEKRLIRQAITRKNQREFCTAI